MSQRKRECLEKLRPPLSKHYTCDMQAGVQNLMVHGRAMGPHPPHSSNVRVTFFWISTEQTPQYNDEETAQESKLITIMIFLFHLGVLQEASFIHCSTRCCCVASNATHRGIKLIWCCMGSHNVIIFTKICYFVNLLIIFCCCFFFRTTHRSSLSEKSLLRLVRATLCSI